MEKVEFYQIQNMLGSQIASGEVSNIYLLQNGDVLKIFDPRYLLINLNFSDLPINIGYNLEQAILESEKITDIPEIVKPKKLVYQNGHFIGYVTTRVKGMSFNQYEKLLTFEQRRDLSFYAKIFSSFESIIKRGNLNGIVFPDFCTCDNIFVNKNGTELSFSLIDYDGLQIGNHFVPLISTTLGDSFQYLNSSKYFDKRKMLFTSELDKKSLIMLYFLSAFNINLNNVGLYSPDLKRNIKLEDIFDMLNLKDNDFMRKVNLALYDENNTNEFLGDSMFIIAEEYDMLVVPFRDRYIKKLIKK